MTLIACNLAAPQTHSPQSPVMAQALNSPEPQQAQRLGSRCLPLPYLHSLPPQLLVLVLGPLSTMRLLPCLVAQWHQAAPSMFPSIATEPTGLSANNNHMTPTYKQNLVTSRNANLAEQHDLRERLKQLESEETQLKGAIAILTQIDQAEAEKAKAESQPTT
jgi:hypothetical protein